MIYRLPLFSMLLLGLVACGDDGEDAIVGTQAVVASVEVTPDVATVHAGRSVRFSARPLDAEGFGVRHRTVIWTSSNPEAAPVDADGLVRTIVPGLAEITATVDRVAGSAQLTVEPALTRVDVTPAEATLPLGDSVHFSARPLDPEGNEVPGHAAMIKWSSSNPAVASVDADGWVRARGWGWATITATCEDAYGFAQLTVIAGVQVGLGLTWTYEWTSVTGGASRGALDDVWGSEDGTVFAVGWDGQGYGCCAGILRRDGSDWKWLSMPLGSRLTGIWGSGSSDVFAVGDGGVLHYDGAEWGRMVSGVGFLAGVWGSSESDVFAVGETGIIHYDGEAWTPMPAPVEWPELVGGAVWGSSGSDVFAVGYGGLILHYDGVAWSRMQAPGDANLIDVWGSSASDVYAVGRLGEAPVIYRYDGTTWNAVPNPTDYQITAIHGVSGSDIFAVATQEYNGRWFPGRGPQILRYDGAGWSVMTPIVESYFTGVWATADEVFVVGTGPTTVLHGRR